MANCKHCEKPAERGIICNACREAAFNKSQQAPKPTQVCRLCRFNPADRGDVCSRCVKIAARQKFLAETGGKMRQFNMKTPEGVHKDIKRC